MEIFQEDFGIFNRYKDNQEPDKGLFVYKGELYKWNDTKGMSIYKIV